MYRATSMLRTETLKFKIRMEKLTSNGTLSIPMNGKVNQ